MENVTIAIVFSIVITALYAVMKYAERYYGPNPEKWDQKKFLQLIVVAFVLVVAAYYGQGVIAMPDTGLIEQAMAILGAAVFALTGIKFGVNASTTSTPTPAPEPTTTPPVTPPVTTTYHLANREWLTFDATPENKAMIIKQIDAAEALNLYTYKVTFIGGYYIIENGQLVSSAGNPSGKS